MKKYIIIIFMLYANYNYAQQLIQTQFESIKRSLKVQRESKADDVIIWSDDFSESGNWIISNDENNIQNWKITNYQPYGNTSYLMGKINSDTPYKYALMDADFISNDQDPQKAKLTNATPIDCSENDLVFMKFNSYYVKFNSKVYLKISNNNGETWTDFEIHKDYEELYLYENPEVIFLDITNQAAGHDKVLIQFFFDGLDANHGIAWMVDDISIFEPHSTKLEVESVNTYLIMDMNEQFNCSFTIQNQGASAINSLIFSYKINQFESITDTIENLNIDLFKSATINHKELYSFASEGKYIPEVIIKEVNYEDFSINAIGDYIEVIDNKDSKALLGELFTSSTCSPCAGFNPFYDIVQTLVSPGILNTVKYQMNWPDVGDPYYTAEGGIRKDYYNVTGVPSLYINGTYVDLNNYGMDYIRSSLKQPSTYKISLDGNINNSTVNVDLSLYTTESIEDAFLFVSVNEKQTHDNTGSNGETEFNHVMHKMIPDAKGISLSNLVADETKTFNFSIDMSTTNMEEINDLEVVAFVQNISTKEVYQTASIDLSWQQVVSNTIEPMENSINIYPNPASNHFSIDTDSKPEISIYSISGILMHRIESYNSGNPIDISHLPNGVYLVTLTKTKQIEVKKLIIGR